MKVIDLLIYFSASPARWPDIFCSALRSRWRLSAFARRLPLWTLFAADDSAAKSFSGSAAFPGRWRISCAAGSSPDAPDRVRRNARSIRSRIQIFQNVPHWGGVCLDQKGLYWEILVKMAAHFGREGDLVLLQTRPLGKDALWRPVHTINITGNPNVPASTYAKVIVDTAVSLTGGRGSNPFFPTKAQIAIQTGL